MKIALFSVQAYEEPALHQYNESFNHELVCFRDILSEATVSLAAGFPAVSVFVNDQLNANVLRQLAKSGTKMVTLRTAGYDNVDLHVASDIGITVMRVPAYSPYAIAEYTIGMILALDRHIPAAWARVQSGNFDINGFTGRGLRGKVMGLIGTGRIGAEVAKSLRLGFGCTVLANDIRARKDLEDIGVQFVGREQLLQQSDVVALHCPLIPQTRHVINKETLAMMKKDSLLVNTSRGGLVNPLDLIDALENGKIRGCALDVYEGEGNFFFRRPAEIGNAVPSSFKRLASLPNVIITGHQAFLTHDAINMIAETTLNNAHAFETGSKMLNIVPHKYD